MSMHGLPRVPDCTGRTTDLSAAARVTWSKEGFWDTALAPRCMCTAASSAALVWGSSESAHYRRKRKRPPLVRPSGTAFRVRLLGVALLELVDAAAGVHDLVLAGVERVRGRRDVHLDQRVLVAIVPLDRLLAGEGRTGQEPEVRGHVLEHDFVVIGMDIGLHGRTGAFCGSKPGILAAGRA